MNTNTPSIQVEVSHYDFKNYLELPRWTSYWHQIEETLSLSPETALVIGVGDGIVVTLLEKYGVKVYTLDFDKLLHPDFEGDVADVDVILGDKRFDVLLCCQVLEHLPYDRFEDILRQMAKHASHVVVSLPYRAIKYKFEIKLPVIKLMKTDVFIHNFFRVHKFDGEHYWEIGTRGYSRRTVLKSMAKYFKVEKCFVAPYNTYHMFFILSAR
jgi:hypothetical protein